MSALAPSVDVSLRLVRGRARRNGMSGRASRAGRAGCRVWLIVFGIVDLSAGLDGIGFNYGGGETLSSKVIFGRAFVPSLAPYDRSSEARPENTS